MFSRSPFARAAFATLRSGNAATTTTGSGSGSLGAIFATGSGTLTDAGSGAGNLGPISTTGSGTLTDVGSGAGNLGPVTTAGSGTLTDTGSGAGNLGPIATTGSGTLTDAGSASISLGAVSATGVGTLTVIGSGSASLGAFTTGVGNSGSGDVALGTISVSASGVLTDLATGSGVLGGFAASGIGSLTNVAFGDSSLGAITTIGTGSLTVLGTGSALFGPIAGSGFDVPPLNQGSGSVFLGTVYAAGLGYVIGGHQTLSGLTALRSLAGPARNRSLAGGTAMYVGKDFDTAAPSEVEFYSFDFTATVNDPSNPIQSADFSLSLAAGVDASLSTRIGGDSTHHVVSISGFKVTTILSGLQPGVRYKLTALVSLLDGEKKELFSFVTGN